MTLEHPSVHTRRRPGRILPLLLLFAGSGVPLASPDPDTESTPGWIGGQIYEENDSILANSDERYTQGLRITLTRNRDKLPCFVAPMQRVLNGRFWSHTQEFKPSFALVFGQNLYTPRIITSATP